MNSIVLVILILIYFGLMFALAYYVDKYDPKWLKGPWVYALSLGVYCTAWTFYGSVGIAATSGLNFLTIYLGPVIAAPLWISILIKIYRISKQQKVSSIADFISLRYGGNKDLGALVTLVCLMAIVPYIALQLKAVAETFKIIAGTDPNHSMFIFGDSTFLIAILVALFAAFFGTSNIDASKTRRGLITSIALESVIKLIFFLIVGIWICFILFSGTDDIFNQMKSSQMDFSKLYTLPDYRTGVNWFFMIILSFLAIFLLPRQFHVSIVELERQKYIKSAIWIFPLYLLLFNVLVIFIAWSGILDLKTTANSDYFSLLIPLHHQQLGLANLVFFGGFSAAISMVVVSTLALSIMLSNNILIPYGMLNRMRSQTSESNVQNIKWIRRICIFVIIITSYIFYFNFNVQLNLFSIGSIAFLIIAQLAPSFFAGLYWNRGSSKGAKWGILVGILVVIYTSLLPFVKNIFYPDSATTNSFLQNNMSSYGGFLNFDLLDPIPNALYWSLLFNSLVYFIISVSYKGNYRERNYAELFVNNQYYGNLQEEAFIWKGEAYVTDILKVLSQFLGKNKAERAVHLFNLKYDLPKNNLIADSRLINFSEKLLTGSIGATSAKILISNVVKEQPISLVEVLKILEESKKTVSSNKLLQEQSKELTKLTSNLKNLNQELVEKDQQKDEFLDTVAHELKTPITSIKAAAEILNEDIDEMPTEMKHRFLETMIYETDRITRLINNLLNFEKIAAGKEKFNIQKNALRNTFETAVEGVLPMITEKNVQIENQIPSDLFWNFDQEKMIQVFNNLLSNSLKFIPEKSGVISIDITLNDNFLQLKFTDNGKGIKPEDQDQIFEKFFQSKNQNFKKPVGSGLGLAITKSIIENHNGRIFLNKNYKNGTQFIIELL